jgi:hypothetical protein
MIVSCSICNEPIIVKHTKGCSLIPKVCSKLCFQSLLKSNISNNSFPDEIQIQNTNHNSDYSMKSYYERKLAKELTDMGVVWKYEPYTFKIVFNSGRVTSYTPDFFLPTYNTLIEVKGGLWEASAYQKAIYFKKFLDNNFIVLFPETFSIIFRG